MSLRQSESFLSFCHIANIKFIPRLNEKCLPCVSELCAYKTPKFINRIYVSIFAMNFCKRSLIAPVRHTLINDVHYDRVRHLVHNIHHVIHVHIFPSCRFCLTSAFGKRLQKKRKIRTSLGFKRERGNREWAFNTFFSRLNPPFRGIDRHTATVRLDFSATGSDHK